MPAQTNALTQAALTSQQAVSYDFVPADFGEVQGRLARFREHLEALVHPLVRITVAGSSEALKELGLVAGIDLAIGDHVVKVRLARIDSPNAVRLVLESSRPSGAAANS